MEELLMESYSRMRSDYGNLLRQYYFAHGSTGFTERNLPFYFTRALLDCLSIGSGKSQLFAWMEVPLREGNHMDAFVYFPCHEQETAFFIESKRFSDVNGKLGEVRADIARILDKTTRCYVRKTLKNKTLPVKRQYLVYLADVWIMKGGKENFPEQWTGEDENSFERLVRESPGWGNSMGPCRSVAERLQGDELVHECLNNYCLLFGFRRII